jgi:hypothetical protein
MDPFDIDTPVDTIQAFASKFTPRPGMKDKVRKPKDKCFEIDQKTKDLWDHIGDKYNAVILGYTKPSTSSPFSSKPPSNHLFLINRVAISISMRCLPINSYRYIIMGWSQIQSQMRPLLRTYQLKR